MASLGRGIVRTRISGTFPARLNPGMQRLVLVDVRNVGRRPLRSSGSQPLHLASRWFDGQGQYVDQGPRVALGPPLLPGRSRRLRLPLNAPDAVGAHGLRVSLVEEHVAWLDDLDERNGVRATCDLGSLPMITGATPDPDGLPGLSAMVEQITRTSDLSRPSEFWERLCELHSEHLLDEAAFARFKRTVNFFYFQFTPVGNHPDIYRHALKKFMRQPEPRVLTARMPDRSAPIVPEAPDFDRRWVAKRYAIYVAILYEIAQRRGAGKILAQLHEPALGRPLAVTYRGQSISQDLVNSALELGAVLDSLPEALGPAPRVLEIGGGYGRLAWATMTAVPGVRYVLVDIPPALALAQRYLTAAFPDRPAFRFRPFEDPAEIEEELAASRIAFLTPDQLELIAPLQADVTMTVSSLHEMRPDQVRRYLELVDRHCRGVFFTKQWQTWHNPVDGVVMRRTGYPYPEGWVRLFDRDSPLHPLFFEALFDVRAT